MPYTGQKQAASPQPIQRGKSLKTQVYEFLRESFLSGSLKSDQLSEANIAARLGVSRTPVREALLELRREGLLSYSPRGGAELPKLLPEDVHHLCQLRILLEGFACAELAGRLSPEATRQLRRRIGEMQQAVRRKAWAQLLRADREFHASLAGATGNRFLAETVGRLFDRLIVAGIEAAFTRARQQEALAEHEHLLDALVAGDGRLAADIMRQHLHISSTYLAAPGQETPL